MLDGGNSQQHSQTATSGNEPLMGIVIRTENNPDTGQQVMDETHPAGDSYTLQELYDIIRCDIIQVLNIEVDGISKLLIADENGMYNEKPPNEAATRVLWESNPEHRNFTLLLGDIAFIDPHEFR
jgi:hypothetical protein